MPHDRFYGIAAEEVARQEVDKDLFARAFALALGDPEKTKAIYIGFRAERLEELAREMAAIQAKKEAETKKREEELLKQSPILPYLGHAFQSGRCRVCGAVEKSVRSFRTPCCGSSTKIVHGHP